MIKDFGLVMEKDTMTVLKGCKPDCLFIGLHYFDQFETIEDVHAADIALHYCITPERLIDFRK